MRFDNRIQEGVMKKETVKGANLISLLHKYTPSTRDSRRWTGVPGTVPRVLSDPLPELSQHVD